MLRQPIVCVLGHVDHGKTTLLDGIRKTAVASKEAGGITQHVSASEIPLSALKNHCGNLLEKMKINLTLPGLLFIDTPGHEAFVNLRKRGGSIADIAILVVDLNQGLQNQTREAIGILKEYKTPFIVAATKIDALSGWRPQANACFGDTFMGQRKDVQDHLDTKLYELVGQLSELGFSSERFDRVNDFTKNIAIVPVSAKTMEGIPELLLFVGGLAQRFLEKQLEHAGTELTAGSILEVKEEKGLGMTLDVIIYRGALEEGEPIVFLGTDGSVIKSKVKAILKPGNRGEKFQSIKRIEAAAGVKIACDHSEDALVGSSFYEYSVESEKATSEELKKEILEIEIENIDDGIIIKADALGSLEAIVKLFRAEKIPIRRAAIGKVLRKDVLEAASVAKKDHLLGAVIAFHTKLDDEVMPTALKEGVKVFDEKIIYNLIINYKAWRDELTLTERKEAFSKLTLPAKIYIMEKSCFRVSNPCIFGVLVMEGRIRKENRLMNDKAEGIGEIRSIQVEKEAVDEAKKNQEVAVAVDGPYFGRQIKERQTLYTDITNDEIELLEKKYLQTLSEGELEVLKEIKKIKGIISFTF